MAETTVYFQTDQFDPTSITPERRVGTVYEVGLNGVGYMLADNRELPPDLQYQRQVVGLDPERFATTETPFAEAIDRYVFAAFSDWTGGAGQRYFDRPNSDPSRFFDSEGIDCFRVPGEISLLEATSNLGTSTVTCHQCVASGNLYWVSAATAMTYLSAPNGTPTAVTGTFGGTINDLVSDGKYWYAAVGTGGVDRGTSARAAWAAAGTGLPASSTTKYLGWAANRIGVSYIPSGGTTPSVWSTLDSDGTEEVTNGRLILEDGWTIGKSVGGGGYVWIPAWTSDRSVVYRWKPGSDQEPSIAWELPHSVSIVEMIWYQGNVVARCGRAIGTSTTNMLIYRCLPDDTGALVPDLVVEEEAATGENWSTGGLGATARFVFFGWMKMTDGAKSGIGCLDLSTGGYARWYATTTETAAVRDITQWKGVTVFGVDGDGPWASTSSKLASGYLKTSVSDKNSTLPKIWDELRLMCDPLLTGESIDFDVSEDWLASFIDVPDGNVTTVGSTGFDVEFGDQAVGLALKLTLAQTGGSDGPTVRICQAMGHHVGLADVEVVLPIVCSDHVFGMDGQVIAEDTGPGKGTARRRALENLAQSRVVYQDRDYQETSTTEVWEVKSVQTVGRQTRDPSMAKALAEEVAIVRLRKKYK